MASKNNPSMPFETLVQEYYGEGKTIRAIAKDHGISPQAVQQRLRSRGYYLRPRREKTVFPRPCAKCGTVFLPKNKKVKFCSKACRSQLDVHKKEFCKHGHPLTPDNLLPRYGKTPPRCKTCFRVSIQKYQLKLKEEKK